MKKTLLIFIFLLGCNYLIASNGSVSAAFLKIGVGAEASGMGDAYTSMANGPVAMYWNAANLLNKKQHSFYFYHNEWIVDIRQQYFSYVRNIESVAIGIDINHISMGNMDRNYISDNKLPIETGNSYSAHSYCFGFGLSKKIMDLSLGTKFKFIKEKIDSYSDNVFALDFGATYQLKKYDLTTSIVLKNMGQKIKLDKEAHKIPFTMKWGVGYKYDLSDIILNFEFDLVKVVDQDLSYNIGTQISLPWKLFVRTGYNDSYDIGEKYSLGFGKIFEFKNMSVKLDYAWIPSNEVDNAHKFSLNINW